MVLTLLLVPAIALAVATIKELNLAIGRDADNKIGSPVFDGSAVAPLRIEAIQGAYDPKAKVVRRGGGGFMTRGPEYNLDPKIKLADLLTEALRSEAPAMGLKLASGSEAAWEIKGRLKDIYMESHQVYMGSTLFYGYMEVEFEISQAGQPSRTERLRSHSFYGAYSAGAGRKDEAQEGLSHLLVEGAQEMLSRLNRAHFKAPPHPEMEKKAASLSPASSRNDLHLVGLSGAAAAVARLIQAIPQTKEENQRYAMIDALGRIGSPEAIQVFAARYTGEDEDCRYAILKALDYIGSPEALAVIKEKGSKDDHNACKRLAARVSGGKTTD
jgi:hypothetical protein